MTDRGSACRQPIRLAGILVLALAFAAPLPFSLGSANANAQEVREHRSIIDLLFRGGRKKPKVEIQRPRKKVVRRKTKTQQQEAVAAVAKQPDARKVLVIGDFMGSALADGLIAAFETEPGLVIVKKTDGSSGLVRADHLDWPQTLTAEIAEIKPVLVVVMLGANDRQQMSVNGVKEKFRSENWNNEYEKRASALLAAAKAQKVPLIWTGLPSFQSPSLSADAATLNNLFRTKTELAGATFIDIWDGFADENGKFIASGSDINGQPVRLRGSDGLSLTRAGKRKMAFFLEKSIRNLSGLGQLPALVRLDLTSLPLDAKQPAPASLDILTVPPISLADPELDGATVLLDSGLLPKSSGTTPRDRLIDKGETVAAPEGRVDDFRIKPAKTPAG